MPQLDHVTVLSQVFWLFLTFICFFIIIKKQLLENIVSILKSRSQFSNSVQKKKWPVSPKEAHSVLQKITQRTYNAYNSVFVKIRKQDQKFQKIEYVTLHIKKTLIDLYMQQKVSKI